MIDGITILTQTELYDVNEALVIIPAIVVLIGALFLCAWLGVGGNAAMIVSAILVIVAAIILYNAFKYPTDEYQYECLIDESVSVTEFYERYDVIERRGEIYKIREKHND
jgi:hypothetical protein